MFGLNQFAEAARKAASEIDEALIRMLPPLAEAGQ